MLSHIIKICLTLQIVTNCRKFQDDMSFICVSLHFNLHIITFSLHISLHIIKSNASDFTHHPTYQVPSTYQPTYQSYRTYRYTCQIHIPLKFHDMLTHVNIHIKRSFCALSTYQIHTRDSFANIIPFILRYTSIHIHWNSMAVIVLLCQQSTICHNYRCISMANRTMFLCHFACVCHSYKLVHSDHLLELDYLARALPRHSSRNHC